MRPVRKTGRLMDRRIALNLLPSPIADTSLLP